jgi:hypothetical protein
MYIPIKFYLSISLAYISSSHHKPIKLSLETNNYTQDKHIQFSLFIILLNNTIIHFFIVTYCKS